MNSITQDMRFRQALIEYSFKYGVTKAAIRYKTNRQYDIVNNSWHIFLKHSHTYAVISKES